MTILDLNDAEVKLKEIKQKLFDAKEDYDINEDYNSKIEKLKEYDGVINGDFEILVPSPNQIKSATDNVGTFSRTDDDIRYREVPNFSFKSLSEEVQENLLKKGWTEEKFNSISQEERDQAIKCIAF